MRAVSFLRRHATLTAWTLATGLFVALGVDNPFAQQQQQQQQQQTPPPQQGQGQRPAPYVVPPVPDVMPAPPAPVISARVAAPDPRIDLKPGHWDAEMALWNLTLTSTTPPDAKFVGKTNSDLAFTGNYVVQGSYAGFQIFDISNPAKPLRVAAVYCPASQSDVSVFKHLLFVSAEGRGSRLDCGEEPMPAVSKDRLLGLRIFDISDIRNPKYVANVQNCRGSHTHSVFEDPQDKENIYVYISGSAPIRSEEELPGCADLPYGDPNTSRFRIDVVKVPLKNPQAAAIVTGARIFQGLKPAPRRGGGPGAAAAAGGRAGATPPAAATPPPATPPPAGQIANPGQPGGAAGPGRGGRGGPPTGPNQCHDITNYPEAGLAGGACGQYGLLLDVREAMNPVRIDAAADMNMSFWHSATFSNDGTKVLFSDEWGGGSSPRCRDTDRPEWGANAIFTIENHKLKFHSYYKVPAPQTSFENCVAHNGSMIPIPGREVMIQGFYQGGLTLFDWTDPAKPIEIGFFDRGPVNPERLVTGGSWSVYWYNGKIISSEIARGLDILELVPSPHLTQNEIDAAKTVKFAEFNAQEQKRFVWPPTFVLARAYADQLERSKGLSPSRLRAVRNSLAAAERATGTARRTALATLARSLDRDAADSWDAAKIKLLATTARAIR